LTRFFLVGGTGFDCGAFSAHTNVLGYSNSEDEAVLNSVELIGEMRGII
jgi:hypothetical protein